MKSIFTLVEDIQGVLLRPTILHDLTVEKFGEDVGKVLRRQLLREDQQPHLRMSLLGTRCDRQLQFRLNPEIKGEELPANARLKFMYGDLIEALILLLAREAGHTVEGEQDDLNLYGVPGHRDAVIDGMLVDVKSANTFAFIDFRHHLKPEKDKFGYLVQLGGYLAASRDDLLVTDKHRAAFLVVDKQLGNLCLDVHDFDINTDYRGLVEQKKGIIANPNRAPRGFFPEPDGKAGNEKLGTECGYCAFKKECYPNLRTFIYSNGPRFLTKVIRQPDVPEAL